MICTCGNLKLIILHVHLMSFKRWFMVRFKSLSLSLSLSYEERQHEKRVSDNRGVGFSDHVQGRYTTRGMAQDAIDVMDHLGWTSNIHLVGLSMGGMITQEIAKLDLPRFRSMTLVSTIAGGISSLWLFLLRAPKGLMTLLRTFISSDPHESLRQGSKLLFPESVLEQKVKHPKTGEITTRGDLLRRDLIERGNQALKDGSTPLKMKTVIKQALAVCTHRTSDADLKRFSNHFVDAVLVITGDSDILVHESNSEILAKSIKGSTLLRIPNAGHGANEQEANLVNKAIEANIRRGILVTSRVSSSSSSSLRSRI